MDNFVIIKEIGQGATGKALLVQNDDGETFVVKKMALKSLTKKERNNAMTEVSVMKQLDHPCIVSYFDSFFEKGDVLCIVMEHAERGDIQAVIDCRAAKDPKDFFEEEQVLDWFTQLCLAVKHLHDMKILHRDLKTENVFLSSNGNVKLGDFGLGKELIDSLDMAKTTAGTPFYLSPEICTGMLYNQKSDVWAMGCILYKLLTFEHAFQSNTLGELIDKILDLNFKPVSAHYSDTVHLLVENLFTMEPDRRPSMDDILLSLPAMTTRIPDYLDEGYIEREFGSDFDALVSRRGSKTLFRPTLSKATRERLDAERHSTTSYSVTSGSGSGTSASGASTASS